MVETERRLGTYWLSGSCVVAERLSGSSLLAYFEVDFGSAELREGSGVVSAFPVVSFFALFSAGDTYGSLSPADLLMAPEGGGGSDCVLKNYLS